MAELTSRREAARARLLSLVPLFYRTLDGQTADAVGDRGPLAHLIDVLADQGALVEDHIAQLYDDWFIETCEDWVVPYIGALIGTPMLPGGLADGQRRFVANTLAYRRRKGTARVLEQIAADVSTWSALAVEAFRGLAINQSLLHVPPRQGGTADLRNPSVAEVCGAPFDAFAHTIDVRRPGAEGPRWAIPNIGLFVWRLEALPLAAEAVADAGQPWLFHADPSGLPRPWFNRAQPDSSVDQLAREAELPVLLRRRPLADELRARRFALARAESPPEDWFAARDDDGGVFRVSLRAAPGDPWASVAPEQLRVCNLTDMSTRPASAIPDRDGGGSAALLVDPVLGRVAVPQGKPIPAQVRVEHQLGYAAPIGAGPFDRNRSFAALIERWSDRDRPPTWQASVAAGRAPDAAEGLFDSLPAALADWQAGAGGTRVGLLLIEDSAIHRLPAGFAIELAAGETLIVAAAAWPLADRPRAQRIGRWDAADRRPHLIGDIEITGAGGGALVLDGLSHAGKLAVTAGRLQSLDVSNCTLDLTQTLAIGDNPDLAVFIQRAMTGAIDLHANVSALTVTASIIDAGPAAAAIRAPGALLEMESASVFGSVAPLRELHASNSLFDGPVTVDRVQSGCVRFCYAPADARMPRRYRCQPETAVTAGADPGRVKPQLVSRDRASPWYGQLHPLCHEALRRGGEDSGEIGAFRLPSPALLEANIRVATGQYLRVGLQTGLGINT